MTLDDLNPVDLYERVGLGSKISVLEKRTVEHLTAIDNAFKNLEAFKVQFVSEPDVITFLDAKIAQLKASMFTIYNNH